MVTASDKAREMMHTPMNDLPPLAVSFARIVSTELGAGYAFSAYGAYAEIVLGFGNHPGHPSFATLAARSYFATALAAEEAHDQK